MAEEDKDFEQFKALKKAILSKLTVREAKVLRDRFGINLENSTNLEEIEKQFEIARERIRQIEAKALQKLRGDDDDDNDPIPA